MKLRVLLAFLALGLGSAIAHDPPNYPRAMIGRVAAIVPEGVVVHGLDIAQIHPNPGPGTDHECFAGVGGCALVRGLQPTFRVGDKIQIMVTQADGDDTYLFNADPAHPFQCEIWNTLSEVLAFDVTVDWDPASSTASAAPVSPAPAPPKPATPSSPDLSAGSIDDPIPNPSK